MHTQLELRGGALPLVASLAAAAWLASFLVVPASAVESAATPHFTVIARGLDNPRGMTFGPEGALYVAEGGRGGPACTSVILFGAPMCYGPSGAVTRVAHDVQQRVATGLGSFAHLDGTFAFGVSDVAVKGVDNSYVTVGGCFGFISAAEGKCGGLFRLRPDGTSQLVADLNAYEVQNNPDGLHPGESDPYDVLTLRGERVVADAAANDVLRVGPTGQVSLLAVFKQRLVPDPTSAGALVPMDSVPDALAVGPDGALYVGELTGFPFPIGGARIYRLVPGQTPQIFADGFTNIIDMAFDIDGSLLVLEIAKNSLLSNDHTGALVRLNRDGSRTTLISEGLSYPTAVAVHDEALYLTNCGTCAGTGQVLRFANSEADQTR
jgi:hypothetical protein